MKKEDLQNPSQKRLAGQGSIQGELFFFSISSPNIELFRSSREIFPEISVVYKLKEIESLKDDIMQPPCSRISY